MKFEAPKILAKTKFDFSEFFPYPSLQCQSVVESKLDTVLKGTSHAYKRREGKYKGTFMLKQRNTCGSVKKYTALTIDF